MKPYSTACDQNRDPILSVLRELLSDRKTVLEVGTGTGQHAVYFAEKLPHLTWQCSDQIQYHQGIQLWLDEAKLPNLLPPLALNVSEDNWPKTQYDALYCANVMHIMSWKNVEDLFRHTAACLNDNGLMICYGPFNFNGQYTSASNAQFDQSLRMRDPLSGIRHFEALQVLAEDNGLSFVSDTEMPANNRILLWQKRTVPTK
jgi:hypothetical protein